MKLRTLVTLAMLATAPVQGQVSLDKSEGTFKLSDGLELKLWGAEPQFVNPTCMDVDHKGRVWICESINYRQKLRGQKEMRRPEGDRILILEDSKGAGTLDKVTVFHQSPAIHSPLGIAVHPYTDGKGVKVFVCQSPDIWVFEDKDGDGKADGPPSVLLTGFKGLDHDHGVHGILIGPDHKLYFTVGDAGVSKLKSSDGKGKEYSSNAIDCRAATVWRCDLDGKNLQLIAHNFRNNYEPCVDSFGTVYLSDNDDDGNQQTRICYVMQGGDYGYHRTPKTSHWNEEHPGIVPKILRTYFGSPTGICMYEGKLLPSKYQGQMLHTDAGPRHLRAYILSPQGAAYAVERDDMVQSTDTWFRPSDVCVAPDGSLFVADWYDPGVGGHNMGDITRGRIYRVAPSGNKASPAKMDLESDAGLLAALGSPNLAVRAAAMSKIEELGIGKAYPILLPALVQKQDRTLRARVLWQLARFGNFKHIQQALDDDDADFRVLGLRIAADFFQNSPADFPEDRQQKIVNDPSAAVRREALLLLQNVEPAKSAKLIHALADKYDGQDRFYLAAIGIAVGHHDAKRREALLADFEKHYPGWNAKVAGLIWELRPPHAAAMLEKRLTDASLSAAQRAQIVDILATSVEAKGAEVLVKALATEKDAAVREQLLLKLKEHLPGKWKGLQTTKELNDAVATLLSDKKERVEALHLIGLGELKAFLPKVIAAAQDEKASNAERLAAIRSLGAFRNPEAQGVLSAILANHKSQPELFASEAVQALGRHGTPVAAGALRDLVQTKDAPKILRQAAVVGLAGTKNGAETLLKDYEAKLIAADLDADLSRLLRNSPFADVKKRAQASLPAPPKFDPKNLPSIQALLTRKGNPERGKQVMHATLMNNAACLKCHVITGQGGKVGPELSVIGSKVSKENLLESILYPSRAIADQYLTYVVETKDGRTIVGVIAEESPTQVIIRDVNANEFKLEPKNIEAKEKTSKSIMPEDLIQYLQEDDLLDLVEYMFTLKSPTISPSGVSADPITPKKGKK